MREFFRELLSANLFVTGILLTLAAFAIFYGTISLLLIVNTGRRLGLLLTGAGNFRVADDHFDAVRRLRATRPPAGRHRGPQCLRDQDHPDRLIWSSRSPSSSDSWSP